MCASVCLLKDNAFLLEIDLLVWPSQKLQSSTFLAFFAKSEESHCVGKIRLPRGTMSNMVTNGKALGMASKSYGL